MQIVSGMAGNRNSPLFHWMLILPVAASRSDAMPTIALNKFDHVANYHRVTALP